MEVRILKRSLFLGLFGEPAAAKNTENKVVLSIQLKDLGQKDIINAPFTGKDVLVWSMIGST